MSMSTAMNRNFINHNHNDDEGDNNGLQNILRSKGL